MSKELWGTYSVIDHLNPRYLALDVMLYDRLVFPVPQRPRIDGNPTEIGDVVWENDAVALEHWNDWDPEAQEKVLKILSPVLRRVYWGLENAQSLSYKVEAAALADQALPDYAFRATRNSIDTRSTSICGRRCRYGTSIPQFQRSGKYSRTSRYWNVTKVARWRLASGIGLEIHCLRSDAKGDR